MTIEEALKDVDYQVKMSEREKEILFLREYGQVTRQQERKTGDEKEIPDQERGM